MEKVNKSVMMNSNRMRHESEKKKSQAKMRTVDTANEK